PETKVIMVYLENFANPLKFLEIARKVTPEKPIIAIKAGRGEKAAKAVASHTGSLAQSDSMIDALMKKAGVVRVFSVDEMIMAAKAMYAEIIPRKQDLAIITNAGGFGVLSIDKAEELGIRLASLNEKTVKFLKENLPEEASCHNPVDLLGTATDKEYAVALEGVLRDPDVGGIVYNFGPPVMQKAAPIAQCAVDLARKYPGRLILSIYMNRRRVMWPFEEAKDVYIAQYDYPEDAVFGYSKLMEYARARRIVREQPAQLDVGREKVRKILDDAEREGKKQLDFDEAEEILKIYGIPVASSAIVRELDQLETQSGHIRFPVAVKPLWGGIVHKTEMNAVRIGIKDKVELALALREISKGIEEITGEKYTRGFVVQEMARGDREIIMGFSRQAGDVPTLIFGLGGIFVEALKDVSIAIPPITRNEAREMIQSIKSYPLLKGFRGKPGIDLESLAETLVRISHLANDFPRIREMDMNPFIASAKKGESLAVDVRMIL
ncbi:MAG: acetate--CoA ligase family protein, partial [Vulcanimicrobiota bacterium]